MHNTKTFYKLKWPDLVEIRQTEDGHERLTFIFFRSNSRPFDHQQTEFAHCLRRFGHDVLVRVSNLAEISLEEFEMHGVYSIKASQTIQQRQGLYNKLSELRKAEAELEQLDQSDPLYYNKAVAVRHLRAMLNTVNPLPTQAQLASSDDALKQLEKKFGSAEHNVSALSLAELAHVNISLITRLKAAGNNQIWVKYQLAKAQAQLASLQDELSVWPDNIEIRSQIIEQEQKVQHLTTAWEAEQCQPTTTTTSAVTKSMTNPTLNSTSSSNESQSQNNVKSADEQ
jgi:hypothetical protein